MDSGTKTPAFVLRRPRLEDRLDEAFGKRLVLLVAGAGYGKSTLLAQWTDDLVFAWHAVTPQDRQLSTFAAGLAEAVLPHVGELPPELVSALAGGEDDVGYAEVVAGHLSDALGGALATDLILVLDDVHQLISSPASLRLVESLCRQSPPTLHVVLASRGELALRIDRLRAHGQVLELSSSDLALRRDEVAALASPLSEQESDLADRIHDVTGGWPAAVRLVIEALANAASAERVHALDRLGQPGTAVYSYLAHEVFEREPSQVRALLRTTAPLESFTVELCEALDLPRAGEVIAQLARRGLFVQKLGDAIRVHALVREFARSAWPLAPAEERSVFLRSATWFESEGRLVEAAGAFAAASAHSEIARLLEARGEELLSSGDTNAVLQLVAELPRGARSAAIEQLVGEALLMQGDLDGSIAAFERAASDALPIEPGLAWRMGVAYHMRGDLSRALESYARAAEVRTDRDAALLLAWEASARVLRNDNHAAVALATQALEIASLSHDDRALAAAHAVVALVASLQGRFGESDRHYDAALEAAERCSDLIVLSRIRTNRAVGLIARSFYRPALAELEEAVRLAERPGFTLYGRTLTNRGTTYVRLGLLEEANADFTAIVELSRKRGGAEAGNGHLGIADVHRERGNVSLARSSYELAIDLLDSASQALPAALAGLARVLVGDDPEKARRAAQRAGALEDAWQPASTVNAVGWVSLALGDREGASEAAVEANRLAGQNRDRYAFAEALELAVFASEDPAGGVDRLEEALSIWRELESRVRIAECELALARLSAGASAQAAQDRALRKLRALGVRVSVSGPAGLLRTIARPAPALIAVQALGGFQLLREGMPVPITEWQSKKARDLLKILVSRRGRPVPREELKETLWPGHDPQRLGNRLSVALSTLRAVLDTERRFDAEHFVRADSESIRLDFGRVLVDVEVFLHEAQKGLSLRAEGERGDASDWLQQAESAYVGSAFEEDPYADWSVPLREHAQATYITVTHALAEDASKAGNGDAAIRYYFRILGHDQHDERAHLGLVATLEQCGRRGEARRSYRAYVVRMEEIGVTPASFPVSARGFKRS